MEKASYEASTDIRSHGSVCVNNPTPVKIGLYKKKALSFKFGRILDLDSLSNN